MAKVIENLEDITNSRQAKEAGLPVFKVITDGEIKAYLDDSGNRVFELVASSDSGDLVDDVMSAKALKMMESEAVGTTMFLNHSYNVPEDVFGSVTSAQVQSVPDNGISKRMLIYKGVVETNNPRAVQTHEMMVKAQTRLGASVSVLITDKSAKTENGKLMRVIDGVKYLECSIVGIPCNQDSWVRRASKALDFAFRAESSPANNGATTIASAHIAHAVRTNLEVAMKDMITKVAGELAAEDNEVTPAEEKGLMEAVLKGLYQEAYEERTGDIYFHTSLLCSAFYEMQRKLRRKELTTENVGGEVATALMEFSEMVVGQVVPMLLKHADEMPDYAWYSANSFLDPVNGLKIGAAFLQKAGARNSKADLELLQYCHDSVVQLGAMCKPKKDAEEDERAAPEADKQAASPASEPETSKSVSTELTSEIEALRQQLTERDAQLAAKTAELERIKQEAKAWEANSQVALLALEKFSKQPLPV